MTLAPGSILNKRYRILNLLGHGGMGSVYRVVDELLNATFALKQNLFLNEDYSEQFRREASIMASLNHQNLPKVGDFFNLPGRGQYLIMEYVEGEDLRQRIERLNKLPEIEVVVIGLAVCKAISYLHSRQPPIIHRDIKPGNIRINPQGEVFLVDFGLAKVKIGTQETLVGARAMTPGYSPPEQYGTARTDERSDIYSLGATLYAALTGMIPCDGLDRITGKARLMKIRDINPSISHRLSKVIEKAMEVDADDRYQTAKEFQDALLKAAKLGKLPYPLRATPPPLGNNRVDSEIDKRCAENVTIESNSDKLSRRYAWVITTLVIIFAIFLILLALLLPGQPVNILKQLLRVFNENQITTFPTSSSSVISNILVTSTTFPPISPSIVEVVSNEATDFRSVSVLGRKVSEKSSNKIAFATDCMGTMEIWIVNSDGRGFLQLTYFDEGASQPACSSGGKQLVYISPCSADQQKSDETIIYIMNTDGSDTHMRVNEIEANININPVWRLGAGEQHNRHEIIDLLRGDFFNGFRNRHTRL